MEMPAVTRCRSSSPTTLTELPENLIQKILSRLPLKDAGRTSTLSRSWRCRWQSVPNFGLSGFNPLQIYQLLQLHSGSIRLFKAQEQETLAFGRFNPYEWVFADVRRWLSILSLHSASTLRTLSLSFPSCTSLFDPDDIVCQFPNLIHLYYCGYFGYSPRRKLSALKVLHLDLIDYSYNLPSLLVSSCPVLERLYIDFYYNYSRSPGTLTIAAPNLRCLKLSHVKLSDFAVTSAPFLETVSFKYCCSLSEGDDETDDDDGGGGGLEDCIVKKVLGGIASIKKFEVDQHFLMFLWSGLAQDTIPVRFRNIMVLSLSVDFDYLEAVSGVLYLLRSTPNLQELNIRAYSCLEDHTEVVEDADDLWDAHEYADLFSNLEKVKLNGIANKKDEIGFIRFLFAKGQVLKTVMISFDQCVNDKESILTELLKLPKASNQSQILLTR